MMQFKIKIGQDVYSLNCVVGVCHCDDLVYLFTSSLFDKEITGVDRKVSEVLIQMWVNFATTG